MARFAATANGNVALSEAREAIRDAEEAAFSANVTNRAWAALRSKRDNLLMETDWWASSDLTITQDQKDYRKALRDLPANTADPTDITWPDAPA